MDNVGEDYREIGRKLFAAGCSFVRSVTETAQLPRSTREIAFAGRSNVGKSSLINALTGHKGLARTSNTPGRTQALNFFALGGAPFHLVDLPGYGHAAAPKQKIAGWMQLVREYLRGRPGLLRVYVLIDGRHGIKPPDLDMLAGLDQAAVSYQVILTKADAVKPGERKQRLAETAAAIAKRPAAFPEVIFTSAIEGEGIDDLRAAIARLFAGHAPSH